MQLTVLKTADHMVDLINATDADALAYIISKTRHAGIIQVMSMPTTTDTVTTVVIPTDVNVETPSVTVTPVKQNKTGFKRNRQTGRKHNKPMSDLHLKEGSASFLWIATENKSEAVITNNGKTKTIKEWADDLGITDVAITQRLRTGWTISDAVSIKKFGTGIGKSSKRSSGVHSKQFDDFFRSTDN